MYYSNHDRGHEPWENPIETTGRPVDEPPRKHKRKGSGAKVAALCLVAPWWAAWWEAAAWPWPPAR